MWKDRDDDDDNRHPFGGGEPHHCDCCGLTDTHTPTCFAARELTDDEFAYLWSFDPVPTTFQEMELLLNARKTGAKVVPPRPKWTLA